ncbi:MAG: helix-turn-helix transcriptional regulator [Fimbriimonas sp.]|nr:helix-turn-helix transcriptional regulator [Fimbriimonas sp.]
MKGRLDIGRTYACDRETGGMVSEGIMTELVRLRKRRKLSQEPIARALGVTQGTVSQIENMKTVASLEEVMLYAQAVDAKIVVIANGRRGVRIEDASGSAG